MKRILALLMAVLVTVTMMVACSNSNKPAEEVPAVEEEVVVSEAEVAEDVTEEVAEEIVEEEVVEEVVEEDDDAATVASYAEIANLMIEDENMHIEARGTDMALVYVFEEDYDDNLIDAMLPIFEEQFAQGDFYNNYLEIKAGCPEMTALIIEFVDAGGKVVYSKTFNDESEAPEAAVEEDGASSADEATVKAIADYINSSGALDGAASEGMEFEVYAEGTVLCIDMILDDTLLADLPKGSLGALEGVIAESFDLESMQESTPALSGINVRILDSNGEVLVASELR